MSIPMEAIRSANEEAEPWLKDDTVETDLDLPEGHDAQDDKFDAVLIGNGIYKPTTVNKDPVSRVWPQVYSSVAVASIHIIVGFSLAFSAILVPQLEAEDSEIKFSVSQTAWLVSSLVIVVPIGAILAGVAMEYLGRVSTVKLSAVPFTIGWVLTATGTNFPVLLLSRLLTGIGSGLGTSSATVYITEIASTRLRGSLVSVGPMLVSVGMVIAYAEGAFMGWRTVAWTGLAYVALTLGMVYYRVPESPIWLISKGKVEEAEKSLRWLSGTKGTQPVPQLAAMIKSQDMKSQVKRSFCEKLSGFLKPTGYKPLAILSGFFFFQQFSGIYVTLFYAVTFFQDIKSGLDPSHASILVGVMRVVMSISMTGLMKKFGRRPLSIFSGISMAICMTVSGFVTRYILNGGENYTWVPVVCVLLYVCASMVGLLSVPWTMTAELYPTEIRGVAHGLSISIGHVWMFIALQSYRDMISLFGGAHGVQWFFAIMSLGGAIFVWLLLPETHNKTLADIEQYFNESTLYILRKKSHVAQNEHALEPIAPERP